MSWKLVDHGTQRTLGLDILHVSVWFQMFSALDKIVLD